MWVLAGEKNTEGSVVVKKSKEVENPEKKLSRVLSCFALTVPSPDEEEMKSTKVKIDALSEKDTFSSYCIARERESDWAFFLTRPSLIHLVVFHEDWPLKEDGNLRCRFDQDACY